jgi:type VI secretion system secreted protein VgrG
VPAHPASVGAAAGEQGIEDERAMAEFKITQSHRPLAINTPLGDDALLLKGIRGVEEMSRPFAYELDLESIDSSVMFEDLLGQNATVRVQHDRDNVRHINGFISQFEQIGEAAGLTKYRATLVPWLWFLTRTADCRIFQDMSAPDIIKKVFRDRGFDDFEDALSGTYATWEYCVQYRETDFNFVSRLMEQEGIYYYFKHANGKHTLVLADGVSAHESFGAVPFYPPTEHAQRDREHVWAWSVRKSVQPGAYSLNEFDFKKPNSEMDAKARSPFDHAHADFEVYDYPGEYATTSDGERLARVRLEELQTRFEIAEGESDVLAMATGAIFDLEDPSRALRNDQLREYLVVATTIEANQDEFSSSAGGASEVRFSCGFTVVPSSQQFRAARKTAKPVIQGPQTAIVVGRSGEEIDTDEHGRVKVQFHWDRYGKADEQSSCWIRVAQHWAGNQFGTIFTPRVGHEVIVEFLEGDPDRPIITGRVYNGRNKPPYELPGNKTMSTIKTLSSKKGGGFNEIRFEDKKDDEQLFIHAQKNMDVRVGNDRFETVEMDRHLVVENDKFEHVKNNREELVGADHVEEVEGDRHLTVDGKEAKAVGGSQSLTVKGDVIEVFKKNQSTQVTDDLYVKAKNIVIEATSNITIKVGQSFIAIESGGIKIGTTGEIVLDAKKDITQKTLANVNVDAKQNVAIKGTTGASLESMASTEVKGLNTTVTGDASVKVESSGVADVKGTTASLKGDVMATVQGLIVNIN